ncbi:hypothetical protein ACTHGU_02605 [Chitinophagaceae bacterium MMS25-I14]
MTMIFQQLLHEEAVLKSEPATLIISEKETRTGRLVLTNKRLLFGKDPSDIAELEIDLDTINKLEQKNHLVDHNILTVIYLQYEEVRFSVADYASWEEAIEEVRMTPNI